MSDVRDRILTAILRPIAWLVDETRRAKEDETLREIVRYYRKEGVPDPRKAAFHELSQRAWIERFRDYANKAYSGGKTDLDEIIAEWANWNGPIMQKAMGQEASISVITTIQDMVGSEILVEENARHYEARVNAEVAAISESYRRRSNVFSRILRSG